jgi:hypothetical protein
LNRNTKKERKKKKNKKEERTPAVEIAISSICVVVWARRLLRILEHHV